eukprot:scaffold25722_cov109-Isochrysis_galbana.AAC.12
MSAHVGGAVKTRCDTAPLPLQSSDSRAASSTPTGARPPCTITTHGRLIRARQRAAQPRAQSSGRNRPISSGRHASLSPQPMRSGAKTSPPCHASINRSQNQPERPMPTGCTSSRGGSASRPGAAAL